MSPEAPAAATLATPGPVPGPGGHFGVYGGRFAPEALMAALAELTDQYLAAKADPQFQTELADLLRGYAGRPTLLSRRTGSPRSQAARSCSSGRTSPTPAPTRSTTCSGRCCWPGGWASGG